MFPVQAAMVRRRGAPLKKPHLQLFPRGVERDYTRWLLRFVRRLEAVITERVLPRLPSIADRALAKRQATDRMDELTAADMVARLAESVGFWFEEELAAAEVETAASFVAQQAATLNKTQVNKVFNSVLSVDLLGYEPYLKGALAGFTKSNAALIKDVPRKMKEDISQVLYRNVRQGLRQEEMVDAIRRDLKGERGVFHNTETRAKLIARDQVSKFNGELTMLRQTEAGITRYTWRTMGDERVRPEHQDLDGTEHAWNDPPEEGHPGEPVNCRCYAEPIFTDLLGE